MLKAPVDEERLVSDRSDVLRDAMDSSVKNLLKLERSGSLSLEREGGEEKGETELYELVASGLRVGWMGLIVLVICSTPEEAVEARIADEAAVPVVARLVWDREASK